MFRTSLSSSHQLDVIVTSTRVSSQDTIQPRPSRTLLLLSTRNSVRTIARLGEVGAAVVVPFELLSPNSARTPTVSRVFHAVVDDPIFCSIWRCREACICGKLAYV
jgi:hypothetical protein